MELFVIYTDKHKTEKAFEWQSQIRIWSLTAIHVFPEPLNDYFCSDPYRAIAFHFKKFFIF